MPRQSWWTPEGMIAFGVRLRNLREQRGISQKKLAAPGMTAAYISRIEAGQRGPSLNAIRVLAPRLGVTPEYLETGEGPGPDALEVKLDREVGLSLLARLKSLEWTEGDPEAEMWRSLEEALQAEVTLDEYEDFLGRPLEVATGAC